MKASINKSCSAIKKDNSRCQNAAIPGFDFCFFHDPSPSNAEKRREAQAFGGRQNRMKTLDTSIPDIKVEDLHTFRPSKQSQRIQF
jgi:hypothetical protein